MLQSKIIMGMPITIQIEDDDVSQQIFDQVFDYFKYVDEKFSPFKETSEVYQINNGLTKYSPEMKSIIKLCDQAKKDTDGYFDVWHNKIFNPSGLVKGWAILNASKLIGKLGFSNYFIDAGGDIQTSGREWKVGIRNPFKLLEIVKVLNIKNLGVATSGTYERGDHIYNPHGQKPNIVSLTVIGPNILRADVMATAAFAMGRPGINFIEKQKDLEGYMIDNRGIATYTRGFEKYVG